MSSKLKKYLKYNATLPIFVIDSYRTISNVRQKVAVGEVSSQQANRKNGELGGSPE